MGFDWHPWCLKCEECGKVLNPGQHAEHKSTPYCHIPCYSALFGPKLFGHGSTVESHQSFGQRSNSFIREQKSLEKRIRDYNAYHEARHDGARMGIAYREVNGRLVLEGVLRVYWGVDFSIRLKEFDDKRLISKRRISSAAKREERDRKCVSLSIHFNEYETKSESSEDNEEDVQNDVEHEVKGNAMTNHDNDEDILNGHDNRDCKSLPAKLIRAESLSAGNNSSGSKTLPKSSGEFPSDVCLERGEPCQDIPNDVNKKDTIERIVGEKLSEIRRHKSDDEPGDEVEEEEEVRVVRGKGPRALRRRHGKKMDRSKLRRRSSINGHWYDRDTSVFTPPKGSCMSVCTTSLTPTPEVLSMLLQKYQVESEANEFALYVVKENGERRMVADLECPLALRVNLGPHENISKLYLLDKNQTTEIRHEVAQYLKFSYAECRSILNMFYEEEEREVDAIRLRFRLTKQRIRERMFQLRVKL